MATTTDNNDTKALTALQVARGQLISLVAHRGLNRAADRFAGLDCRCQTEEARMMIDHLCGRISEWELQSGGRVRKRRAKTGAKFTAAVEGLVADLLLARAGSSATGRAYRTMDKNKFKHSPVGYDVFLRALKGLEALGYVRHEPGKPRYRATGFGFNETLSGIAARYWATPRLVGLAKQPYGIHERSVGLNFSTATPANEKLPTSKQHSWGQGTATEPLIASGQ